MWAAVLLLRLSVAEGAVGRLLQQHRRHVADEEGHGLAHDLAAHGAHEPHGDVARLHVNTLGTVRKELVEGAAQDPPADVPGPQGRRDDEADGI